MRGEGSLSPLLLSFCEIFFVGFDDRHYIVFVIINVLKDVLRAFSSHLYSSRHLIYSFGVVRKQGIQRIQGIHSKDVNFIT